MDYKLFTEYITLQALLKECGIIHSGGAIKAFLADTAVFVNEEAENRRGKKLRIGDCVRFNDQTITLIAPSTIEIAQYHEDKAEKERVAKMVKALNATHKKTKTTVGVYRHSKTNDKPKKKMRFPGLS